MSIISLEGISKKYGDQIVFNNFHLEIEKGEYLVVTGKSGSGKTTLLNLIGLLEKPDQGCLSILGVKNPDLNRKSGRILVRDHIGYLFQNFALVENQTARQNVELVCRIKGIKSSDLLVSQTLDKLGIAHMMNKKIYQLSGGEQQRVALARLLIKKPDIVLADEPTASLDPMNAEIILNAISELHQSGTTVVLVTHNPNILQYSTRNIHIDATKGAGNHMAFENES